MFYQKQGSTRDRRIGSSQAAYFDYPLRSIDSSAQSLSFSHFMSDPLISGKNAIAFRFQGAVMRPRNGVLLPLDRRFFPGDEIVRGFARGAMTAWAYPTGPDTSPSPVGADTVLGFSAEYRIPLQGPLSAAAFLDLGWSGLRNLVRKAG